MSPVRPKSHIVVLGPISAGGFGKVDRVLLPHGGVVARKTFEPQLPLAAEEREKVLQRFRREVRVQSELSSDFFISIYEHDLDADPPWFTMPLADCNYEEQIKLDKASGTISSGPIADILNGLEELHALGYTHRDLKPANILKHDGRWKLSDFGLVLPPLGSTTKLTATDSAWGTPKYAAPEQARDFHRVTPAADVYAMGCILHDLVSDEQRIPFHKQTADGPIGLIIEKCTEIQPARRFKTIAGLRGSLLKLLSSALNKPAPPATAEWVEKLKSVQTWSVMDFNELVRYLDRNSEAPSLLLVEIDEEALDKLHALDSGLFDALAEHASTWATESFPFAYCDVVVRRLQRFFDLGSLSTKARAMLSAAQLGRNHNRWFVMGIVTSVCGPSLDDNIARRIAIEIRAESAVDDFAACAQGIGRELDVYHPTIFEALTGT